MKVIEKLNELSILCIDEINRIEESTNTLVYDKAPIIVHERLCNELTQLARINVGKIPREIPEMNNIMIALDVIESIYPKFKQK